MTPFCLSGALSIALLLSGAQDDLRPAAPTSRTACCDASALAPAAPVADAARALTVALPVREERGYIGISMEPTDDGMRVVGLYPGGPAAEAGIQEGDVVLRIGKVAVAGGGDDVMQALSGLQAGKKVKVQVRRGEETFEKKVQLVTLASLEDQEEVAVAEVHEAPQAAIRLRPVAEAQGSAEAPQQDVRVFRFGGDEENGTEELRNRVRTRVRQLEAARGAEQGQGEVRSGRLFLGGDGAGQAHEGWITVHTATGDGESVEVHPGLGLHGGGEHGEAPQVRVRRHVQRVGGEDGPFQVHVAVVGDDHDEQELEHHVGRVITLDEHDGAHAVRIEIDGDDLELDDLHQHLLQLHGAHGQHGQHDVRVFRAHGAPDAEGIATIVVGSNDGDGSSFQWVVEGDDEELEIEDLHQHLMQLHGGKGMPHGKAVDMLRLDGPKGAKVQGKAKILIATGDGEPQVMEFDLDGMEGLEHLPLDVHGLLRDLHVDGAQGSGDFRVLMGALGDGHGTFEIECEEICEGDACCDSEDCCEEECCDEDQDCCEEECEDVHYEVVVLGDGEGQPRRLRAMAPRAGGMWVTDGAGPRGQLLLERMAAPARPAAPAAPRFERRIRMGVPAAPRGGVDFLPAAGSGLHEELRGLREEIEALRDEVRSLRRELRGRAR